MFNDESLKNTDPLRWISEMNLAKKSAEEIVLKEYVYA
ncbi:MAG: TnpV protein [Clostridia bacterium]|nr:TnpV protein [Clostridia bacterium]